MKNKYLAFALILILGVTVWLLKRCNGTNADEPGKQAPGSKTENTRGLNRNTGLLPYYSKHAKCRMECRHISKTEVEEVLRYGKVNYKKSDLQGNEGPTYAVEDITSDGQKVRIVFAPKKTQTTVVTVIDLNNEWNCPSCN